MSRRDTSRVGAVGGAFRSRGEKGKQRLSDRGVRARAQGKRGRRMAVPGQNRRQKAGNN